MIINVMSGGLTGLATALLAKKLGLGTGWSVGLGLAAGAGAYTLTDAIRGYVLEQREAEKQKQDAVLDGVIAGHRLTPVEDSYVPAAEDDGTTSSSTARRTEDAKRKQEPKRGVGKPTIKNQSPLTQHENKPSKLRDGGGRTSPLEYGSGRSSTLEYTEGRRSPLEDVLSERESVLDL